MDFWLFESILAPDGHFTKLIDGNKELTRRQSSASTES